MPTSQRHRAFSGAWLSLSGGISHLIPHPLNTKILWRCWKHRRKEGHSCVAGDMLPAAMRLVPDCIDITVTLGNMLVASRMYSKAEADDLKFCMSSSVLQQWWWGACLGFP
uniref:Uncharacterized protein n=1 Tax=Arundo donax TaxID=35708 RepID=A0A0A9BSA5_ARUDO